MSKTEITWDEWAKEMAEFGCKRATQKPDPGYFSTISLAEIWKISRSQARRKAREQWLEGKFDQKFFMTDIGGQTGARPVPHYKLKK